MRHAPIVQAERNRVRDGPMGSTTENGNNGAFVVPCGSEVLRVIVSDLEGWDHVSVSASNRVPTWEEMCYIKRLFFKDDECVIQYHPPESDYINNNPNVLHLWRPQGVEVPMPPKVFV